MTTLTVESITLPGSSIGENPFPHFRERTPNRVVPFAADVPPRLRELAGWNTGARVLPYRVQDRYDRARQPTTFKAVVLENAALRATFLPELGGRLISLFHTPSQRELLSRNPVFQPANLAIRNAWFSGGIEWNVGQYGHSVFTCAPVFAAQIAFDDGTPGLRLYEFERMKRLFWHTDFYLPEGSQVLFAYTRVVNPYDAEASMYWWTNIAVPEAPDVRVITPAAQALYLDWEQRGFGLTDLPGLPSLGGKDGTYSANSPFANEFFMQCDGAATPFIAALDAQGTGLFEASTPRLNVRKLFCWGMHQGGRRWQEYLAEPGMAYIEIQAGLAPTQLHGAVLPPRSTWDWIEAFGLLQVDPARVHDPNWDVASRAAGAAIQGLISSSDLAAAEARCRALADTPARRIVQDGSGWGALELRRRAAAGEPGVPACFAFPEHTLAGEPARWLTLLERGEFAAQDPQRDPGGTLVQPEWRTLLAEAVERAPNWHALLHLGVMLLEACDEAGAERMWRRSIELQPTAWAHRNLAALSAMRNEAFATLAHYGAAWDLAGPLSDADKGALAREVMGALVESGQFERAAAFFDALPPGAQADEPALILRAKAALALGDLETVESILAREFATIREGEVSLTDLWFEMWARRDGTSLDQARRAHPAPRALDFRAIEA